MTEEEIRNLKTGDKITITLTAKKTNDHMAFVDESGSPFILSTSNIHRATLVKPAPKFEVGDIVRIIPDPMSGSIHGAYYKQELSGKIGIIQTYNVKDDEGSFWLRISGNNNLYGISPHCLELVKKAAKAECDRLNAEWRKKQEGKDQA